MPGETSVAAPVRTHPERFPEAERDHHASHSTGTYSRGLSHFLCQARRLHKAGHHSGCGLGGVMPYTADRVRPVPDSAELRARIPGWGADLDPKDRPSVPREYQGLVATGAHWDFPERQEPKRPRERSIEHEILTPVFGTSAPT